MTKSNVNFVPFQCRTNNSIGSRYNVSPSLILQSSNVLESSVNGFRSGSDIRCSSFGIFSFADTIRLISSIVNSGLTVNGTVVPYKVSTLTFIGGGGGGGGGAGARAGAALGAGFGGGVGRFGDFFGVGGSSGTASGSLRSTLGSFGVFGVFFGVTFVLVGAFFGVFRGVFCTESFGFALGVAGL